MLDLELIREARPRVMAAAIRTPLLPLADTDVLLKLEILQPVGSFKLRGAANAIGQMAGSELSGGVLTASAGNMAQAVAWCARRLGIACTIVVPDTAPQAKLAAVERLGGRIIRVSFDRWWQTFTDRSYPGVSAPFVHPFNDLRVMAGNGTIGLELLEDEPDLDAVIIPWGGGGLAAGIASAVRALRPGCRIYAVELETGAPLAASLGAGAVTTVDYTPSWVDGIGSRTVFPNMLALARELLDGSIVVSLAEVREALRLLVDRSHVVPEGAGAASVAAALAGRAGGGRIACIISGGSIGAAKLAEVLSAGRE